MTILVIIIFAVLIDIILSELPSNIHPVVLMGAVINTIKKLLSKYNNKVSGIILTITVLIIFTSLYALIIELFKFNYYIYILISALLLSTTFAIKSLLDSINGVKNDMDQNIDQARDSMSYLVSRNTSNLSEDDLISASIETLTENITDSIIAPLIYTFIFGVIGGVFYRVVNTLDAMVGYKNPENINVGWFPANLDDILNYIPARITGFLMVIASMILKQNWRNAYKIMIRDSKKTASPNSGYPMAAAAGFLGIQLKKQNCYELGDKINQLTSDTIDNALLLTKMTILIFLILSTLIFILCTTLLVIYL